jgi:hypothetical protein
MALVYHACVENQFFNVACKEETELEKWADTLLIPYQYAFMGRVAEQDEEGVWHFTTRFDYSDHFWWKNIPCWVAAPASAFLGGALKAYACLDENVRERYRALKQLQPIRLHNDYYREVGLFTSDPISGERFVSQGHTRRPGDENHLAGEKEALRDIAKILTEAGILWWVDCGTCLGAYRYGGMIPWDFDVDIAVLEPDFENVYTLLRRLPEKYVVIDISSRDRPMSLLKVYLRDDPQYEVDIYHFRIHPEDRTLAFILSQENHFFMLESWRERERPFKAPVRFEDVFPLKRADFDGIEVFVPNHTDKYLARVYGEDLSPAKKYDPLTGQYEKDLSHPYWQRPFAH